VLKWLLIFLIVFESFTLINCAKRGTLTGGLKDTIPPALISANPPIKNLNFNSEKITLNFNEYIELKDINEQLIISPPLEKKDYKIIPENTVTKKVEIEIKNKLRENSTFTFNFGSSIVDYNESNALPFFNYTFSTGDYIDSLKVSGFVKDAYEIDSLSFVSIHLYPIDSVFNDSTIYNQKPFYVGNTLDSIYFELNNLAPGKYEFIAIKDKSKNYYFDQSFDKIGFFENPIEIPKDTFFLPVLFKEITNFQWGRAKIINDHHIEFPYYGELGDKRITIKNKFEEGTKSFFTRDRYKDTLHFWFTPQKKLDSIITEVDFKDSTAVVILKPFKIEKDSLVLKISPSNGGKIDFLDTLKIKSNLPITEVNEDLIQIFDIDTLEVPFSTKIDKNLDFVYLNFEKLPNDLYQIQILPNAVNDFLGSTNDTIFHQINTTKTENYGKLFLSVKRGNYQKKYILELITSKGELIRRIKNNLDDFYSMEYLLPGEYQIRIIKDANGNGRWDTGNYLKKIQPEEVKYLKAAIIVRANWELNETIEI